MVASARHGRESLAGHRSALSGGYTPDSARAEGSSIVDEPGECCLHPCARQSKTRTGRCLREKLISDHSLFSSQEGQANKEPRTGKIRKVFFQGCTGLWTAGCLLARRLHHLKAFTAMDLGISIFLISA